MPADRLTLYYGGIDPTETGAAMRKRLPSSVVPNRITISSAKRVASPVSHPVGLAKAFEPGICMCSSSGQESAADDSGDEHSRGKPSLARFEYCTRFRRFAPVGKASPVAPLCSDSQNHLLKVMFSRFLV